MFERDRCLNVKCGLQSSLHDVRLVKVRVQSLVDSKIGFVPIFSWSTILRRSVAKGGKQIGQSRDQCYAVISEVNFGPIETTHPVGQKDTLAQALSVSSPRSIHLHRLRLKELPTM